MTSDLRVAKGVRAGPTLISPMRLPFGPLVPLPEADWQLAGSLAGLGGGRGFLCPPPIPLGLLWVPDSACAVVAFDGGDFGCGAHLLRLLDRARLSYLRPSSCSPFPLI